MKIRYTIIGRNGAFLPHLAFLILVSSIICLSGLDFQVNVVVSILNIIMILFVIYTLIMLLHFLIDDITINNQRLEKKFLLFKRTIDINTYTKLKYKNVCGLRILIKRLHIISGNQRIALFDWYKLSIIDIEARLKSIHDNNSIDK